MEATHAEEEDIWWLWSRLRSDAKNIHGLVLSCNPDNASWLLKYAMWYLYPEGHELAGRPDPAKNGRVRYLLRINGDVVWGETAEELKTRYGEDKTPISFCGLFGTIDDNPPLKLSNPLYRTNLESLPNLDRERLLYGNWFARPENSTYYTRESVPVLLEPPKDSEYTRIVRSYDFAGTLPHDGNRSPDYFASVKMGKLKNGNYVIIEADRTRITFGDWLSYILRNAKRDGHRVDIILPEDPNAASKAATTLLAKSIAEEGYVAKMRRSSLGKLDAFRPFAATAELGVVSIVKDCATDHWNKILNDNDFFHKELESFDGKRRSGELGHDDLVDCCSLAYLYLAQRLNLPNFSSGLTSVNLSTTNPFTR